MHKLHSAEYGMFMRQEGRYFYEGNFDLTEDTMSQFFEHTKKKPQYHEHILEKLSLCTTH